MRQYDWNEIDQIAFELKNDKAAIVETDTVMGIICRDPAIIYKVKKRNRSKKLVRFITSIDDVDGINEIEKQVIKQYWPGELTIIKKNIAYRIPNHKKLLELIKKVNFVYSSSANISGKNPVFDDKEATLIFKNSTFSVVIVKGRQKSGRPSTIINLDNMKVIRNGSINGESVLNQIIDLKKSS